MLDFRCEFMNSDNFIEVIRGTLRDIQRVVGGRSVVLDGVAGHFELGDDEGASPQFVIERKGVLR